MAPEEPTATDTKKWDGGSLPEGPPADACPGVPGRPRPEGGRSDTGARARRLFRPGHDANCASGGGGDGKGEKPTQEAGVMPDARAYRLSADAFSGSTTSGRAGADGAAALPRRIAPRGREHPPCTHCCAGSYRHPAQMVALFIRPPFFPSFSVEVTEVFDAHLLVLVDELLLERPAHRRVARQGVDVPLVQPRSMSFSVAAPTKRDEVAGRIIPADASMNDVMNLKAAHVITERAALAVTRIDCLARFVRDGCGQVSFGLHIRSPLSCDTASATRQSRAAKGRLRSP